MLLECFNCGKRGVPKHKSCSSCGMDFSFLVVPQKKWGHEEYHDWLYSEHYQIYDLAVSKGWDALSEAQKLNYLVGYLYFQVMNGGVWQYFFNSCGPDAPRLALVLEEIGAIRTASAVRECLEFFPSSTPPIDMAERSEIIRSIPRQTAERLDELVVRLLLGDQDGDGAGEEPVLQYLYLATIRSGVKGSA